MMAREPGAKLADIAPMRNRELLRVKTKKKQTISFTLMRIVSVRRGVEERR